RRRHRLLNQGTFGLNLHGDGRSRDLGKTLLGTNGSGHELEGRGMKKFLLGAAGRVAAMGVATSAFAADLPARPYVKAPAMIAAIYDWSGFYVGLNAGGGSARKCWDINNNLGVAVAPAFREGCHDATGALAGGQIGFRWQSGEWVFG